MPRTPETAQVTYPSDLAGQPVLTEEERAERFRQFTLETGTTPRRRPGPRALTTSNGASAACCSSARCYASTKASRALTKRVSTRWLMCKGFDA